MKMHMPVFASVMSVLVSMHLNAERLAHRPNPHRDEQHSDQSFTHRRDLPDGQYRFKENGQHANEQHARRMPQTPAHARHPGSPMTADRQRRHRRQMVRPRQDMEEPSHQPREHRQHGCKATDSPPCRHANPPRGPVASKLLTPSVGGLAAGDQLGSFPIRQFPARDHGFKTPRLRATAPGSVTEMASSGEDHGHAPLVGRADDLLIAH